MAALEDDLNTSLAITHLRSLLSEIRRTENATEHTRLQLQFASDAQLMGLLRLSFYSLLHPGTRKDGQWRADQTRIDAIWDRIDARSLARTERRFADADRIRDELAAEGIVLEDHRDGSTTWHEN
jgi:cysteinyl-tRNA synthetase